MLLAVAVHAGDAEDLAGPEIEAHLAQRTFAAPGVGMQVVGAEPRRAAAIHVAVTVRRAAAAHEGFGVLLMLGAGAEHHADHLIGDLRLAHGAPTFGRDLADHAPEPQHGDAVAELIGFH